MHLKLFTKLHYPHIIVQYLKPHTVIHLMALLWLYCSGLVVVLWLSCGCLVVVLWLSCSCLSAVLGLFSGYEPCPVKREV